MESFVIPGSYLSIKSDKIYAGEFTHIHNGNIHATVAGRVSCESKPDGSKLFNVVPCRKPCPIPVIGSIVLAKVNSITRRLARCDVVAVGDQPLAGTFRGMIRREDIRSTQRDRAEPSLSFRPGDLVRARVINLIGPVTGGGASTSLPSAVMSAELDTVIASTRAVSAAVNPDASGAASAASASTCLLSTAEPELGVVLGLGRPPLSGTASLYGATGGTPLLPTSWTEMVCPKTMIKFSRKVAKVPDDLINILVASSLDPS